MVSKIIARHGNVIAYGILLVGIIYSLAGVYHEQNHLCVVARDRAIKDYTYNIELRDSELMQINIDHIMSHKFRANVYDQRAKDAIVLRNLSCLSDVNKPSTAEASSQ